MITKHTDWVIDGVWGLRAPCPWKHMTVTPLGQGYESEEIADRARMWNEALPAMAERGRVLTVVKREWIKMSDDPTVL